MRIETHDLSWRVDGRDILKCVDVELPDAAMTGVIGPNGCGKTTLLHLVAGLRKPSSGHISYGGSDAAQLSTRERARRVALVEQYPQTGWDLSVREIVALGRIPHTGWLGRRRSTDDEVVEDCMVRCEVDGLRERRWATLSGGERQRVQLARALAQQPQALLLDEPTNHLDLRHQIELLRTVQALDTTVVAVLHDLDLAAAFCDRLVIIGDGRVLRQGRCVDVLDPEIIARVFGVHVTVEERDRIHVDWTALA